MAIDITVPRTRRALLAGALGGLAATVAGTLGQARPASAHDADDVRLGAANSVASQTSITNTNTGHTAFNGIASGSGTGVYGVSASGYGVYGATTSSYGVIGNSSTGVGVYGTSSSGTAVSGFAPSGTAVYGHSPSGFAVYGDSTSGNGITGSSSSGIGVVSTSASGTGVRSDTGSTTYPAVLGQSKGGNTGVFGYSGLIALTPDSPPRTGVYGYAAQDDTSCGVTGETTVGRGVNGIATSGIGVFGKSTSSVGVYGQSDSDVGVKASSLSNSALYGQSDTGYALEAVGRLKLSTAGIAMIPAGSTSKPIISYLLTAESFLLLTPGVDIGTRRLWFTKNVAANTITINLSSSRTSTTKVSWLLLG